MEPLNKGHIGIRSTGPCKEAVLISEVNLQWNLLMKDTLGSGLLALFRDDNFVNVSILAIMHHNWVLKQKGRGKERGGGVKG